jgi:hypothetical protein
VDEFTYWVLERLVGVKGRNPSDVAYFVLRDWIQAHREELEHLGISVQVAEGRLTISAAQDSEREA